MKEKEEQIKLQIQKVNDMLGFIEKELMELLATSNIDDYEIKYIANRIYVIIKKNF